MFMTAKQAQFEALVQAYSADLYRYAVWLCHSTETAEDLVQEAFLRAWKSLDSLQDSRAAKAWLITILRRENARRFQRKRPENDALHDVEPDQLAELAAQPDHIKEISMQKALARLSEDYKEPLLLQVLGGYSCEEIGDILGITTSAVMTRVFRARQKMRNYLGEGHTDLSMSEYG